MYMRMRATIGGTLATCNAYLQYAKNQIDFLKFGASFFCLQN